MYTAVVWAEKNEEVEGEDLSWRRSIREGRGGASAVLRLNFCCLRLRFEFDEEDFWGDGWGLGLRNFSFPALESLYSQVGTESFLGRKCLKIE